MSIDKMLDWKTDNVWTDKEFDERVESFIKYDLKRFSEEQKQFIIKSFVKTKADGYFRSFVYRDHNCFVEFDDIGKWRIYVELKQNDAIPIDHDIDSYNYNHTFLLKGFNLLLWDYNSYIGLDDFIGVALFSSSSWEDYFQRQPDWLMTNINTKKKKPKRLISINSMVKLCQHLVDCLVSYNENSIEKSAYLISENCLSNIHFLKNRIMNLRDKNKIFVLEILSRMLDSVIEKAGDFNG